MAVRLDDDIVVLSDENYITRKLYSNRQIYTNKTGDCLFIFLSVCSAMDGQTARPEGVKFEG